MADYDWTKDCGCSLMGPHKDFCEKNPNYKSNMLHAEKRVQGYHWSNSASAYMCRRGCGTLVWDTETHSQNVCREFNPIAAN